MSLARLVFRLLLGRRLPHTQGTLTVPGCKGSVTIHRDRYGIPLIEAGNSFDAHFAVGFCHGQDRAFQLEVLRRVATGTLSELIGEGGLRIDKLARRIGFVRASRQQLTLIDPELREALHAYSLGVNAGVRQGCPRLPHEYSLLRAPFIDWEPLHCLSIVKLLSFTLCSNWDAEVARLRILQADGPEALAALDPAYPSWHPVTDPPGQRAGPAVESLWGDLNEFFQFTGKGGGSNNWVVAGSRTTTGRPILANDPHLDASLPAHWYLARVRFPELTIAGATFVGGPSFLVGHNGHACWGLTAGLTDNTDLFQEEIGPDGASVRRGAGFVPCEVVEEVIHVKNARPVTECVLLGPHGPIVSPSIADELEGNEIEGGKIALSLRACWLDPVPIEGLLMMAPVRSFEEFRSRFSRWPASPQNMAYADASGTIGWQLVGRVPVRRSGCGALPLPGWDERAGWEKEALPYEELPHLENPEVGYLATANNKPRVSGRGPFLGVDFLDGYREAAITRALQGRRDWDIPSTQKLQLDQHAVAWEEMRDVVLGLPAENPAVKRALDLLRDWDGDLRPDSSAAAVYEFFLVEMMTRAVRAKAPKSAAYALGKGLSPINSHNFLCFRRTAHLIGLLREQPVGWFPRPWPVEAAEALANAIRSLEALRGPDSAQWGWGQIRKLVMHHPLTRAGGLGLALGRVFNLGPVPCGGDADVINQAAVFPLMPTAGADNIPSLRAVFDVGAWHNSRFQLPGGQSGNPLSPHYADLFELYCKGQGVPLAFTEDEVRAATVQTLNLQPQG
jgi:penicillin amidase